MRFVPAVANGVDSPMGATRALLALRAPDAGPVLDLSQAAPSYPPPDVVAARVAEVARSDDGARYTPVPGIPPLREAFAAELSRDYAGTVAPEDVAVTAGCNQAFCLVASVLTGPGDEVITHLPRYFNHDMWLRMHDVTPVHVDPGPDLVPRAAVARALITPRTRAIVLVTPGNPSGVTIPPSEIAAFAALARRHGLALVLDETYRSFREVTGPPHALFADPAWRDTVVSLHSFSKDLAVPGHRVGAIVADPALTRQTLKLSDCVAICAPRVGQEAVLAGLRHAGTWRAERAREVAERRARFAAAMAARPGGFEAVAVGGFFGWVRHPFGDRPTDDVVRDLLLVHDVLVIGGTAFLPDDRRMLRLSVANAGPDEITALADRLAAAGREILT